MAASFQELCNELKLPLTYEQESNLNSIEVWCYKNISQDICYNGNSNEKYSNYLAFAKNYLDNFIVHLPDSIAQKTSFYSNLSAIHYAAQQGYNRFIENQSIISEDVINEWDNYGMTPLHKAAIQGYLFTVQALLTKGANAHKTNAQKQLPIHSALFVPIFCEEEILQNKEKIVRELLPFTPEVLTMQDTDGNTIVHLLATNRFDSIITQLIDMNPQLAFIKNNASLYPIHTAILNQQFNAIDFLLSIKNVATLTDSQQCLPLHYAARYGTAEMVRSCCLATENIDSRDGQGRTPLLCAAYAGNEETLAALIKNGADPKCTDYQGFSILHVAVKEQNEAMVRWIVDNLGDVLLDQVDAVNNSPLFYAKKNKNHDIEAFLINGPL